MNNYKVYSGNNILINTTKASSYKEAFNKVVGDYIYKEISKKDCTDILPDIIIHGERGNKYYLIRFG